MSEEYGNDFVVLTDEEGNEEEFEHLDTLEYNGETYMAFIPAEMSALDEAELIILKLVNEGEEDEMLESVDDEGELETIYNMFLERLESDDFYGDDDDDETEDEE